MFGDWYRYTEPTYVLFLPNVLAIRAIESFNHVCAQICNKALDVIPEKFLAHIQNFIIQTSILQYRNSWSHRRIRRFFTKVWLATVVNSEIM